MERRAGRVRSQVAGAQVGLGVDGVRDDAARSALAEVVEAGVVGVEDRDRCLLDQARLRRAIGLERAVELEVLAGDGGDDADVEATVARPLQRQAVGRRLHHHAVVAGRDHPCQQLLQLERLRRRVAILVRRDLVEDADLDGPDLARVPPACPQHLRRQRGHGRLAVRPVTPITVSCSEGRPNQASAASARARRVRSTTSCGTRGRELALDHEAERPAREGIGGEVVAVDVDARDGEEERARRHRRES